MKSCSILVSQYSIKGSGSRIKNVDQSIVAVELIHHPLIHCFLVESNEGRWFKSPLLNVSFNGMPRRSKKPGFRERSLSNGCTCAYGGPTTSSATIVEASSITLDELTLWTVGPPQYMFLGDTEGLDSRLRVN